MIKVSVKLYAHLREAAPSQAVNGVWQEELPKEFTLKDLLAKVGLAGGERSAVVVMVNGRVVKDDYHLVNRDEISMFPPLVGG